MRVEEKIGDEVTRIMTNDILRPDAPFSQEIYESNLDGRTDGLRISCKIDSARIMGF